MKSPAIHQTPLYRAKAAYRNMVRRCENKCGTEPAYANVKLKMTMAQWLEWAMPRYEKFLAENPGVRPSVSRRGDKGHYQIGNVEIVAFGVNRNAMAMPRVAINGKKRCNRCEKIKPISKFFKNATTRDGLSYQCNDCRKDLVDEYRLNPKNAARIRAKKRETYHRKKALDTDLHFD